MEHDMFILVCAVPLRLMCWFRCLHLSCLSLHKLVSVSLTSGLLRLGRLGIDLQAFMKTECYHIQLLAY